MAEARQRAESEGVKVREHKAARRLDNRVDAMIVKLNELYVKLDEAHQKVDDDSDR